MPVATAIALAAYTLTRPDALFGVVAVDDGVYFGAAIRLVDGVLPYRDFVLLHPPGIETLLVPVAFLSHFTGARVGLAAARVLTELVTVANVGLVALLLRRRGRWAAGIAALALALFPLSVSAANTLTLEPYFVLFALLGASLVLREARGAFGPVAGGVALAVAIDIKLWALLPAGAALAVVAIGRRGSFKPALAGTVGGLVVAVGPFMAAAPSAFFHDVVVTQFVRATSSGSTGIDARLFDLSGVAAFAGEGGTVRYAQIAAVITVVLFSAAYGFGRQRIGALETFALVSWVALTIAVLSSAEFYPYYAYAPAAFEALVLGGAIGVLRPTHQRRTARSPSRSLAIAIPVLVAALFVGQRDFAFCGEFVAGSDPFDPAAVIDAKIPPGACVVTDQMSLLIDADRVTAAARGCPAIVDPYGTWLAADAENPPPSAGPYADALVATWQAWLGRAQYLLLEFPIPDSHTIPAAASIVGTFNGQYLPVYRSFGANVYLNTGTRS